MAWLKLYLVYFLYMYSIDTFCNLLLFALSGVVLNTLYSFLTANDCESIKYRSNTKNIFFFAIFSKLWYTVNLIHFYSLYRFRRLWNVPKMRIDWRGWRSTGGQESISLTSLPAESGTHNSTWVCAVTMPTPAPPLSCADSKFTTASAVSVQPFNA